MLFWRTIASWVTGRRKLDVPDVNSSPNALREAGEGTITAPTPHGNGDHIPGGAGGDTSHGGVIAPHIPGTGLGSGAGPQPASPNQPAPPGEGSGPSGPDHPPALHNMDPEQGQILSKTGLALADEYNIADITYGWDPNSDAEHGGKTSDCSHFVTHAIHKAKMIGYIHTAARQLATDPTLWRGPMARFVPVAQKDALEGDLILSTPPGREPHMGIYTGKDYVIPSTGKSYPEGVQMGHSGAKAGPWGPGSTWPGLNGPIQFFRPKVKEHGPAQQKMLDLLAGLSSGVNVKPEPT
jgi:hypothetical protein